MEPAKTSPTPPKQTGKVPPVDPDYRPDEPRKQADAPPAGPVIKFDLPRGNTIEIRLKAKVTADEFKKIRRIFKLSAVAFLEDDAELEDDNSGGDDEDDKTDFDV